MEPNPYFPSLRDLASQRFALSSSVFSDETRSILYGNEDLWQQVWSACKRYNRINDLSFAALLNLSFDTSASETSAVSSQGRSSQLTPNRKAPVAAAKKAAVKKPANVFALLAGDDDDDDDETDSNDSSEEESDKVIVTPTKPAPRPPSAATKVEAIESHFAIRHLDLCDLAFIRESLITKAIQTYGNKITSLNLGRCYQITMSTAKAIRAANMPLAKLVLSGCRNVDDAFVNHILPCLANLESLDIGALDGSEYITFRHHLEWDIMRCDDMWSPPKITKITGSSLSSITKTSTQLTHLNMSGHVIADERISEILSAPGLAERLISLDLSYCSDRRYGNASLDLMSKLKLVPNLRHLKAEYVSMESTDLEQDEREKITLQESLPLLETLHVCGMDLYPQQISKLTKLRDLSMSDVFEFGSLIDMAPQLTRLMPVNFGFPGRDIEDKIAVFFPQATNLRVLDGSRLVVHSAIKPLNLITAIPHLEKAEFGALFKAPEGVESTAPALVYPPMRSVKFSISHFGSSTPVQLLVQHFPYLQKLEISGWPEEGGIQSSDLASISKLPFLKSLTLAGRLYTLKSPKDLKMISRLRYLEELSISISPSSIAPFFAWRHKFATKLRKLALYIKADKVVFPRTLEIATKDIPEWCNTKPAKLPAATWDDEEEKKPAVYVDPLAGHPLFPSLIKLTISKVSCLSNRFWSLLARDVCPNIHTLELLGDMHGARTWETEQPVDNHKEEGKTEEVVHQLLGLFKRLTSIYLRDCWKFTYIKPEKTPHPPQGYITKKYRFLQGLRDKNIAVFIRFENWGTYRSYGSFATFDSEAAIAGNRENDDSKQDIYL
eukprot:TRINITY_DN3262_c0_g1_i2.p1 TRINITY_DN3262_c0_g1~~TRINITY_DN3262_c0_g1_i2.p1  ORF type:complete len:845 (-),score=135.72 TRINITY_DN3262_c0_g1_i2:101-2611(-)